MDADTKRFAILISGAHGVDHFLKRIFPPLIPLWVLLFGYPLWKLGVVLGALTFGTAIAQAPAGHLADRYDRRLLLPGGIALMAGCCILFAAITGLDSLETTSTFVGVTASWRFVLMVAIMVFIGIGSSVLHPTGYPLISQNTAASHNGAVLGMWGSARSFGDGLAPAAIGVGLLITDWRLVVAIAGGFGVIYAGFLFRRLATYETHPVGADAPCTAEEERSTVDWWGNRRRFLFPLLAVFASSSLMIIATAGANVFLTEFITSEYAYSFSLGGISVTPTSTASFYYSALLFAAGIAQLGMGRLIDHYETLPVLLAAIITGGVLLLCVGQFTFSPVVLFSLLILLGATLWGLNPARDAIVSAIAPSGGEGRTFGYLWTGMLLIASISPVVVGYIGDMASLREAFVWLAGFVFVSAIPIVLLFSNRVYDVSNQFSQRNT